MKKYIFLQKDLEAGNIYPYLTLNIDENEKEFVREDYVLLQIEEFLQELYYYDSEKKELRKKTKLQLYKENLYSLEQGEIFDEEKQEFSFIQRPSSWHVWDGHNWTVDLEEVKRKKREELKYIREIKISENLEVHGSLFQVREKDLENFEDVARAIRRKKKQMTDTRTWILADNSIKTFTYAQLLDVLDMRALRKEAIFNIYGQLSMQLQQAKDIKQIENINWK